MGQFLVVVIWLKVLEAAAEFVLAVVAVMRLPLLEFGIVLKHGA